MAIEITRLSKRFMRGRQQCCALDGVDLSITDGEMVALIGPSGSGKSTLMRHIAGLVAGDPGQGEIRVDGQLMQAHGRIARDVRQLRGKIGFVFQQFNLVGRLDVLTNVLTGGMHRLPLWRTVIGAFPLAERQRAMAALARVGMDSYAGQRASTLSGGQQQRVAIARAVHQGARTVLADEPIASLDPSSAQRVMEGLAALNQADGATVVVSLHQVAYARAFCRRAVALRAGRVVFDGPIAELTDECLAHVYDGILEDDDGPRAAPASAPAAATPVIGTLLPQPAFT